MTAVLLQPEARYECGGRGGVWQWQWIHARAREHGLTQGRTETQMCNFLNYRKATLGDRSRLEVALEKWAELGIEAKGKGPTGG